MLEGKVEREIGGPSVGTVNEPSPASKSGSTQESKRVTLDLDDAKVHEYVNVILHQ